MRSITRALLALLVLTAVSAALGCGKKADEEGAQPISANINNNAPGAASAPSAELGESPGALAARMNAKGGIAKKLGR